VLIAQVHGQAIEFELCAVLHRAVGLQQAQLLAHPGIEGFGAGKPVIAPGYRDPEYPYRCELDPDSLADAILAAWRGRDTFDARAWAARKHDVHETVRQMIAIFQRYL
jgi:hypothetical protein